MIPAHFLFLTLKILFSLCFVVGIISQVYKRGVVIVGVVSLTMGNSALPLADGLVGDAQPVGDLLLGRAPRLAQHRQIGPGLHGVHVPRSSRISASSMAHPAGFDHPPGQDFVCGA